MKRKTTPRKSHPAGSTMDSCNDDNPVSSSSSECQNEEIKEKTARDDNANCSDESKNIEEPVSSWDDIEHRETGPVDHTGGSNFRKMLSEYLSDMYIFQAWLMEDLNRLEELINKPIDRLPPPYTGPNRYLPINFEFVLGGSIEAIQNQMSHLMSSINSAQIQISILKRTMEERCSDVASRKN